MPFCLTRFVLGVLFVASLGMLLLFLWTFAALPVGSLFSHFASNRKAFAAVAKADLLLSTRVWFLTVALFV
jgi:non-ribosomal peptide synthetase component E (peptide arylation enzyme)